MDTLFFRVAWQETENAMSTFPTTFLQSLGRYYDKQSAVLVFLLMSVWSHWEIEHWGLLAVALGWFRIVVIVLHVALL